MQSLEDVTVAADLPAPGLRSACLIGLVAVLASLLAFTAWMQTVAAMPGLTERRPAHSRPFADLYNPATRPLEVMMNGGDGQAYAAMGRDPLLRDPDVFWTGRPEAAYRAQRPLLGWLAFASVAGQRERVPEGIVLWTMLGVGLLVAVVARALERAGAIPWAALFLVATPGVLSDLRTLGPEALGCGLAVLGTTRWRTHRWQAVACFTLSVLCRETLLLVPAVLALHGLVVDRRLRRQLPLLVAPAVLGAWVTAMRLRTGSWPTDASRGRLSLAFSGLADAAHAIDPGDAAALALFALVAVAVVVRARDQVAGWIVLAHVAFAGILGEHVWLSWHDFGRVLLPLVVFGLIALAAEPLRCRQGCQPG